MEPSIRVVERAAPCAFHGAHDFLRNDLDPSEYLGYSQKKVYQDLYELGELFKSLATSEYPEGRLLPQLKELFLWLHGKGSAIATEGYTQQAAKNIVMIRHRGGGSGAYSTIICGCKACNKMSDPLYYLAYEEEIRLEALDVLTQFFVPYESWVEGPGGRKIKRAHSWKQFWIAKTEEMQRQQLFRAQALSAVRAQCEGQVPWPNGLVPGGSSTSGASTSGSSLSSFLPSGSTAGSDTSTEATVFMDWDPDPSALRPPNDKGPEKYECFHHACRTKCSVVEVDPPRKGRRNRRWH